MHFETLEAWLTYIGSLRTDVIDLGLDRVLSVATRLKVMNPGCPVITVAGTNGKGSCAAGLEAIYLCSGYRVGVFTSPFLFRYNEQVRIQGKEASDWLFCVAFEQIEAVRADVKLTPFEFNTLAAWIIFCQSNLDVWILEVGLGGRLDAVNVIDADLAIVSSIAIDHAEWLGNTRELIGYEKAGIFRTGKPAVCGDFDPPLSLQAYAAEMNAPLFCQGRQFGYEEQSMAWRFWSNDIRYEHLPIPKLALQNMATVLMAIELMQALLPVNRQAIEAGLSTVALPGRIQVLTGAVTQIFDVSHNPAAAAFLIKRLDALPCQGKTSAVFSMLADKDIVATLQVMQSCVDDWYIAALPVKRAASIDSLLAAFQAVHITQVTAYADISEAYRQAILDSRPGDCLIVFGSFHVVAAVYPYKESEM